MQLLLAGGAEVSSAAKESAGRKGDVGREAVNFLRAICDFFGFATRICIWIPLQVFNLNRRDISTRNKRLKSFAILKMIPTKHLIYVEALKPKKGRSLFAIQNISGVNTILLVAIIIWRLLGRPIIKPGRIRPMRNIFQLRSSFLHSLLICCVPI